LSSPYREALNQRNNRKIDRKKSKINPPGKITLRKNISPAIYFGTYLFFPRVFELPLSRNAQKRTKTNNKKRRYVRTFFCELAQTVPRFIFSAAP
jgi:hypothetical protein